MWTQEKGPVTLEIEMISILTRSNPVLFREPYCCCYNPIIRSQTKIIFVVISRTDSIKTQYSTRFAGNKRWDPPPPAFPKTNEQTKRNAVEKPSKTRCSSQLLLFLQRLGLPAGVVVVVLRVLLVTQHAQPRREGGLFRTHETRSDSINIGHGTASAPVKPIPDRFPTINNTTPPTFGRDTSAGRRKGK